VAWCTEEDLSSLHLLFTADEDVAACEEAGLMLRHTVQFHWTNVAHCLAGYRDFDDFLAMSLSQEKRKKIRQERRKVPRPASPSAGRWAKTSAPADWDFFYRCYERTYYEHGNAPYLSRDFFQRMQDTMPENWLLFVAERNARAMAASLIALSTLAECQSECHS
jgi:predicted N-acyltransferase